MAIDLDKARAARREAAGQGPVVKFAGKEYQLQPELPFGFLEALKGIDDPKTASAALAQAAVELMGRDAIDQMKADGFAVADLDDLIQGVLEEYGVSSPLPSSAS